MTKKKTYETPPKNGRQRVRRSYVVYLDTAEKFGRIARVSGVLVAELLEQTLKQVVDEWEREHGEIAIAETNPRPPVSLSTAIRGAQAAPALKRGNPHGRRKKDPADE